MFALNVPLKAAIYTLLLIFTPTKNGVTCMDVNSNVLGCKQTFGVCPIDDFFGEGPCYLRDEAGNKRDKGGWNITPTIHFVQSNITE